MAKLDKYIDKINPTCCDHSAGRRAYLIGYTGLKVCKVAMCLDCESLQFIGGKFSKMLYPLVRKLSRGRLDVLTKVGIDFGDDGATEEELLKEITGEEAVTDNEDTKQPD